jgi:site-specific recombinase XerD
MKQQHPSGDMYLSEINMQFATDLEHYIRNNPINAYDPCKGNGVGKHIQRFKRIIKWAADEINWLKVNPVAAYSCPLKRARRKKLTIQEVVVLESQNFNDIIIQQVKDLFLFSCYTGFAFADTMQLQEKHFEWDLDRTVWCKVYRTKSEELSPVPLLPSAIKILEKFKAHAQSDSGNFIFPRISNQHVNRCLKIIQAVCSIETPMTFHVARHTFAKTVALKNGIPLETVQMMMGHTKITTTQIYADVDEEKIINDMIGLEDKLNIKRELIKAGITIHQEKFMHQTSLK